MSEQHSPGFSFASIAATLAFVSSPLAMNSGNETTLPEERSAGGTGLVSPQMTILLSLCDESLRSASNLEPCVHDSASTSLAPQSEARYSHVSLPLVGYDPEMTPPAIIEPWKAMSHCGVLNPITTHASLSPKPIARHALAKT